MNLSRETTQRIDEVITHYPVKRSASLPLLHLVQEEQGFISDAAIEWIAAKLGLEPINVYELVTFYPMFRRKPIGRRHIKVCRTLSCALKGGYKTCAEFEKQFEGAGEEATVEFVECLASCGTAPVAMIDDTLYENVDVARARELAGEIRRQTTGSTVAGLVETGHPRSAPAATRKPHERERRLIFKHIDEPGYANDLACYLKHGGYEVMKKAYAKKPEELIEEVKRSGLRGRGGAGFPCGMKWSFVDRKSGKPIYLVVNADESEPGTFKDRYIIHQDPHQLIEGVMISCYANNVKQAYIYIRGEFPEGARILEKAIAEARAANLVGPNVLGSNYSCEIYVHRGAGAYICGEETGLIESLEGKRPYPRIKPPYFPAVLGLYQCPTIMNNVETLCHVKHIVEMGGDEYAKIGTPGNTGTRILCVSGHVQKPGFYEFEVGRVTMGQLLNEVCGGPLPGRKFKAVIPGGSSAKVLKFGETFTLKNKDGTTRTLSVDDIPMDFDTLAGCGTMGGSGGVIVMDDSVDMVEALANINAFYAHESCGQCTPCREGSLWMKKITNRMVHEESRPEDGALLKSVADQIAGRTICAFGEACAWPTQSFVAKFGDEFAAHGAKEKSGKNGGMPLI